ncbi:MAG: S-layer homology domain-containing protein [Clostridiales bacterium]|nr:S-layer homology domain-containing protein [Clostridiales bacterium]
MPAMVLALLALAIFSAPFATPRATAKEADQTWYAFTDIHGHWAMGPILQMAESLGFSKTDTAFRPDDPIEGPVWTAWLTRLLPQARACIDIYPKPPECSALGSPQEGPLTRQALVADLRQALSVTPGVYNPHFRPDPMPVDLPPKDTAEFQLAWDGLSWGYLEGYPDGTLRLEQVATRAEAVQMLSRVPRLFDRSILQETSDAQALLQAASDAFHLFTHVEKDILPRWQDAVNRLFAGGFRRFWVDTDVLHATIGFDTARMKALLAVENTEGTGMNWAVFDLSFRFHDGEWQIEDFSIVETHENTPEAQVPRYDRAWIIGPEVTP